jgi:fructan beta-fructosidase
LTLRTTDDGIRMFATPVKEIEQLRKPDPQSVANTELTAESPAVAFDVADQLFDIEVIARRGTAARVVLRFGENVATYDFAAQKLDEMPLKMKDGKVTFRVLVDRPMYELIGGGGACYKTSARRDMGRPLGAISVVAEGGSLTVEFLKAYEMASIWNK